MQGAEAVQDACAQLAAAVRPDVGTGETAAAVLAAVTAPGVDIVKNGADMANVPIVIAMNAAGTAQSAAKEEDAPLATAANLLAQSAVVLSKELWGLR